MKILYKTLGILSIPAIAFIIFLFASENIKFADGQYKYDPADDRIILSSIKQGIKRNSKYEVLRFGATEIEHLSGTTFLLKGSIVYKSVSGSEIKEDFECVATGWSDPYGYYQIDMYSEE